MDSEKNLHNSTEPLVLRPPVGSEVYGKPSLLFRQFSNSGSSAVGHNQRRRRLLLIYVLCVLITLAVVSGLLFAMFVLNFGPFASRNSHIFGPRSMCRVFSPLLRTSWVESLSADDNVLNVTLSNMPQSQTYWILHLCSEMLTVIRTERRCFIRPMRAEMAEACARGYLKMVHNGQGIPDSVEAKIKDEFWFTEPPNSTPKVIRNSLIMAWCEGVPAFRLVSRPPPADLLNVPPNVVDGAPMPSPSFVNGPPEQGPTSPLDPDRQEVIDQISRKDQPFADLRSKSVNRHRRSLDLADQMGVPSNQLPVYYNSNNRCTQMDAVLEDATVSQGVRSGSAVPVVRDHIYECH